MIQNVVLILSLRTDLKQPVQRMDSTALKFNILPANLQNREIRVREEPQHHEVGGSHQCGNRYKGQTNHGYTIQWIIQTASSFDIKLAITVDQVNAIMEDRFRIA